MKWNSIDIQKFLIVYENYPQLWNVRLNDYRNATLKDGAFKTFIEELRGEGLVGDMTDKQLKAKIKSIRDSYRQELAKITKSRKGGVEPCDIYKPKLAWFETADFLREVMSTREKLNLEINDTCDEETDLDSDGAKKHSPSKTYCLIEALPEKMKPPCKRHKRLKTAPPEISDCREEDVYDLFGKYIASELRALPSREATLLQQDVQSAICKTKLSLCQPSSNYVYNLPLSVEIMSSPQFQASSRRSSSSTENSCSDVKVLSEVDITNNRIVKSFDHEYCNES